MDLLELLELEGVAYERHEHAATYTAQQLAAAEHVPGRYVAKPVLVWADSEFILCVLPAPMQVDLDAVRDALCAGDVRLASELELAGVCSDCELGAQPPIGGLFGLRTLMDFALMDDEYLVFQAGTHNVSVRLRLADFERVADPILGAIAVKPDEARRGD